MDPVSALGLASSVMSIIQFSLKVVQVCGEVTQIGRTLASQRISESSEQVASKAEDIRNRLNQFQATSKPLTSAQMDLQELATQCIQIAKILQTKLKPVQKNGRGRKRSIAKAIVKGLFGESDVQELEHQLRTYEDSLRNRILVNLYTNQEIQHLEQQGRLDSLDANLRDFIRSLAKEHTATQSLVRYEAAENRRLIKERGQETNDHIDERLQAQRDKQVAEEQRSRFLGSLRFSDMNDRRSNVEFSHADTFKWIFNENENHKWDSFTHFLRGSAKIYWIQGKPGSGKSCLMKFICRTASTTDTFREWIPQRSTIILSYYLWNSGTKMQKAPKGLWMSLSYQLLEKSPDLATELMSLNPEFAKYLDNSDWSEYETYLFLKQSLGLTPNPTCIFIDALDEVDSNYGSLPLIKKVHDLSLLENVKVCVSSRPELEFKMHLQHYPHLKLEDLTRKDIERLARDTLEEAFRSHLEPLDHEKLDRLVNLTVRKAEGVFLWASFALKSLQGGLLGDDDWGTLEQRLEMLPPEIGDLYRAMWKRLNRNEQVWRADAAWYFQYVLQHSKFLLDPDAQLLALTFARNPHLRDRIIKDQTYEVDDLRKHCSNTRRQVIARCAGLLEFHDIQMSDEPKHTAFKGPDFSDVPNAEGLGGRFDFIHRSAREFLETTPDGRKILEYSPVSHEEVLRMQFLTSIALVVVANTLTMDSFIKVPDVWNAPQDLRKINGFKDDEAYEMIHLFIQNSQELGGRYGISSLEIAESGWKPDLGVAKDLIGSLTEFSPELAYSFLRRFETDYQVSQTYATYLLKCVAVHGFDLNEEGTKVIGDGTFELLKYLLDKGADPNAKISGHSHRYGYSNSSNFFDRILWFLRAPRPDVLQWFERLWKVFIESGCDLKQEICITLTDRSATLFQHTLSGRWVGSNSILIMKANKFEYSRWISLKRSLNSFEKLNPGIMEEDHPWKAVYFQYRDHGIASTNFSHSPNLPTRVEWQDTLYKLTKEDAKLLSLAVGHFMTSLEQRGLSSPIMTGIQFTGAKLQLATELWENTIDQTLKEVRDRCELFHGEQEISEEFFRAGLLLDGDE